MIRLEKGPFSIRVRAIKAHLPDMAPVGELYRSPVCAAWVDESVFQVVACPDFAHLRYGEAERIIDRSGKSDRASVRAQRYGGESHPLWH